MRSCCCCLSTASRSSITRRQSIATNESLAVTDKIFFKNQNLKEVQVFHAVDNNDQVLFRKYIDEGFDISMIESEYQQNLLHRACENGSLEMTKCILDLSTFNKQKYINALDKYGDNCLTLAIRAGSLSLVQYLIEDQGQSIDNEDTQQRPIMLSVEYRRPSIFKYLIKQKANTNFLVKNTSQPFIIWMIRQLEETSICRDPFELKAYIKTVVTYSTTDINAKDNFGNTALFYALVLKDTSMVHLLCEFGADVNITINNSSIDIMDYALSCITNTEIIEILQRRTTSPRSTREVDISSIQLNEIQMRSMNKTTFTLLTCSRRTIQPGPQSWLA